MNGATRRPAAVEAVAVATPAAVSVRVADGRVEAAAGTDVVADDEGAAVDRVSDSAAG
jgi:hypothetical protein